MPTFRPGAPLLLMLVLACAGLLPAGRLAAQNEDFTRMSDHLGFLGYRCAVEEGGKKLRCVTEKANLNFSINRQSGGYLIASFFRGSRYARENLNAFLNLINNFNNAAVATRYYLDADGDLAMELWLPGAYIRDDFGNAIENFNKDWSRLMRKYGDEVKQFLK